MKYSFVFFFALIFLGAGCFAFDQTACIGTTPWGSCVTEDGMDQALLGNWILDEQTISKNGQTVGNPFHGRKLSIDTSLAPEGSVQDLIGRFQEDFSSETGGSGSVAGVTSTCTSSGSNAGTILVGVNTSVPLEANGTIPASALSLAVTSEGPTNEVECSAGGSTFSSNSSSIALGEGFSTTGAVAYEYLLSDDWESLTLIHHNPASGVNINYLFHAE